MKIAFGITKLAFSTAMVCTLMVAAEWGGAHATQSMLGRVQHTWRTKLVRMRWSGDIVIDNHGIFFLIFRRYEFRGLSLRVSKVTVDGFELDLRGIASSSAWPTCVVHWQNWLR